MTPGRVGLHGRGAALRARRGCVRLRPSRHAVRDELERLGIFGRALRIVPVTEDDAMAIARLRPLTRAQGLSLGDRACLALGQRLNLPEITADRAWAGLSLRVEVRQVR